MKSQSQAAESPPFESSGRVNQKRRTRAAIVAAARAIHERSESPTVAQAAEEAEVSRTTAYRYFPTLESLLLELSLSVSLTEMEGLFAETLDDAQPGDRLLALIDALYRYVAANETLARTNQRLYLDTWLAAERAGDGHATPVREGRRKQWLSTVLVPLRDTVSAPELEQLVAALSLIVGPEAYTVLRDVCQLDLEEAIAVAHRAGMAMLDAAAHGPSGDRAGARN
ncbi:MAG: Bacterial regulatory protein tetR family [Acidimicrobiaceae bacterium]|nr:Bacterial regulatory protein tetR family [Acidimicrobiaceae bacterium]